jgi:hypothetical protein
MTDRPLNLTAPDVQALTFDVVKQNIDEVK